jgi:hypothetical protein
MKLSIGIALCALLLAGCGTPSVVRMDGDTYFIEKRSAQAGFGPPEGAKAEVYEIANKFCEARGMTLETVNFTMVNSGFARPGSVALQFRCVPRGAKQDGASTQLGSQKDEVEKRLQVIKDMRDHGLITEEEYQKKRAEILSSL